MDMASNLSMMLKCYNEKVVLFTLLLLAAFFFSLVRHFEAANIPLVLAWYEVNPAGISLAKRRKQIESRIRIIIRNWHWGVYPIWGIFRVAILKVMSYALVTRLKEALYR